MFLVGVGIMVVLVVVVVLCIAWMARSNVFLDSFRGAPRILQHGKINLLRANGGNCFPFEKLNEKIFEALLEKATPEFHRNLYKRVSSNRAVNERRGKKFELIVHKLLLQKQAENPHLVAVEREKWLSGDSRVDFFLRWGFPQRGELIALVECKHSVKAESLHYRLEEGVRQLRRYKRRYPNANLLILVVDFQIPSFSHMPFTVTKDQEILLINYAAFPLLFDAIADFMFSEVNLQRDKQLSQDALSARFKEFNPKAQEEEILDLDVLVASLEEETTLNKRERKSAPYKALLEFFQEKLGENTRVEFEIESEALRDKMGVSSERYRVEGKFWPSLFKVNCLLPNIKKLERHLKIKVEVSEKRENSRKTLIFKVERLEGYEEEKRSENII